MSRPRFEISKCLGSGGFGEVYLATEYVDGLHREVALKVLHDPLDEDSDSVKRLRDEGQVLALIAHPAVLGVHAFAKVGERLALVTEYVEGVDLAWFCVPERLLPHRVVIAVTQAVAEALDYAWRTPHPHTNRPLHLIHRDLKPENVRLSSTGQVKILDFGVARSTEMNRRALTAAGQVILTPGYGAPETLMFGVLGPAVDVFALGATVYAMLTGESFYADDLGAQVRLAGDSVDYARYVDERLSKVDQPDLHVLLRDMLEFAHEQRPEMHEIVDRCERLSRRTDGPSLKQWARDTAFPEAGRQIGRLDGAMVMSGGEVVLPNAPALPLSQRPTIIAPDDEPAPIEPAPTEPAPTEPAPTEPPVLEDPLAPQPAEPLDDHTPEAVLMGVMGLVMLALSLVVIALIGVVWFWAV